MLHTIYPLVMSHLQASLQCTHHRTSPNSPHPIPARQLVVNAHHTHTVSGSFTHQHTALTYSQNKHKGYRMTCLFLLREDKFYSQGRNRLKEQKRQTVLTGLKDLCSQDWRSREDGLYSQNTQTKGEEKTDLIHRTRRPKEQRRRTLLMRQIQDKGAGTQTKGAEETHFAWDTG